MNTLLEIPKPSPELFPASIFAVNEQPKHLTYKLEETAMIVGRAAVVNHEGDHLVAWRLGGSNARTADKWEVPGGKKEPNEDIAGAIIRETAEEVGVKAEIVGDVVLYNAYTIADGKYAGTQYLAFGAEARYVDGEATSLSETRAVAWMPREEILDLGDRLSPDTQKLFGTLGLF